MAQLVGQILVVQLTDAGHHLQRRIVHHNVAEIQDQIPLFWSQHS